MKKIVKKLTILVLLLGLVSFVVAYTLPGNSKTESTVKKASGEGSILNVPARQFNEVMKTSDGIILDVRTKRETDLGHIQGASFLDISSPDFVQKMKLIQKDKAIYVYCLSGARSYRAAQILAQNGYTPIYNLNGGLLKWKAAGFEITRSTEVNQVKVPKVSLSEFDRMLETDKKVLVEFKTTWCAPCKKMEPIMAELKKEFENEALIIQIDASSNMDLYKQYKVSGVPEFIIFEHKNEVWRHTGIVEDQELKELLAKK